MEVSQEKLDKYLHLAQKYGADGAKAMMEDAEQSHAQQAEEAEKSNPIADMINRQTEKRVNEMKERGEYKPEYQGGITSPRVDSREYKAQPLEVDKPTEQHGIDIAKAINQGTKDIISNPGLSEDEAIRRSEFYRKNQ